MSTGENGVYQGCVEVFLYDINYFMEGEMKRIVNYHKIREFKSVKDYINYYNDVGIQEFIEAIRVSGILINPYDTKNRNEELINGIGKFLNKNKSEEYLWGKLLNEAGIINDLYSDLYSMDLYRKAESVPTEKAFASFAMILEKYLRFLTNEIEGNEEKNKELRLEFHSDFAYGKNMSPIEKTINIYEHIVFVSDMVLKYLLFYKCRNVEQDMEIADEYQNASFAHLVISDQKTVIQKIEKEWQFFNRTIKRNGNYVESLCDSKEFLDFHVVNERLSSRKNKIMNDIRIGEDAIGIIGKEEGISDDERSSILYLKNVLAIESLSYMCSINKRNNKVYRVPLNDLVRAYAVIKMMVDKFSEEEQKFSNIISDVCLILEEGDIVKEFVISGIPVEQAKILIKVLKYENYKDIFDTPLIPFNKEIMLIPSIVKNIHIAQVILSCVNQFNFEGEAFERLVLSILQNAGINAISEKYQDETGVYQCDVLFGIKRTLFVCECKAWGEPHSIISYCERNEKCFGAYEQLNRIAQKYQTNKDELCRKLGMKDGIIRMKKIIILSNAVGIENTIEDVYFVDYSAFHLFCERRKPSVNLYHEKKLFKYALSGFNELEGAITENKLLTYIANTSPVQLMIKNTEKQIRIMSLLNYELNYDTYILKENDYLMPDKDIDEYMTNIKKIYDIK